MGGLARGIFGSSGSSGSVNDVTPIQFARLRDPVEANVRNLLTAGVSGGPQPLTFPGPNNAPITGGEQQFLGQAQQVAGAPQSPLGAQAENFLSQVIGGQIGPQQVQPLQGTQGAAGQTLNQTASGAFLPGQQQANPFLQAAIDAATRPLFEQFSEVALPRLRAGAVLGGQQPIEGGSSPFDMAVARAQSGLANAVGDVGTNIAFQGFQQERGLQQQAALAEQARQQQAGLQEQSLNAQLGENQAQRQQQAAQTAPQQQEQLQQAQLQRVVEGLRASALPRLIEDQGIERGMQLFQNRINTLLQTLGLAGGLGQPQTVATQGSPGTPGLLGSAIAGFAPAAGQALAGRIF